MRNLNLNVMLHAMFSLQPVLINLAASNASFWYCKLFVLSGAMRASFLK